MIWAMQEDGCALRGNPRAITWDMPYPTETIRKGCDDVLLYDEHAWGKAYPTQRFWLNLGICEFLLKRFAA